MSKKIVAIMIAITMILSLASCGKIQEAENGQAAVDDSEETAEEGLPEIGTVSASLAEDKDSLINTYASKFTQDTYSDDVTGLSITYNLYLPDGYDEGKSYPMVVFIGDMTTVGDDATRSLTQGRGALVWASEEWQSVYPTIVAVPTYPETIIDDRNGENVTEYVDLTKSFIEYMSSEYSVDINRIYGTGQSMGCMTTLYLASQYPDLYAACMFVDGQWNVDALTGLENEKFVYFAAEDDQNAWNGAQELMAMMDADSAAYKYKQWDGNWSPDELTAAAQSTFEDGTDRYFISWAGGTVDAGSGGMGGSVAYHMASFDYAYNAVGAMEWLFHQSK